MKRDGLRDKIEVANRHLRIIYGQIQRCDSLPQTEAVQCQKHNYISKLEAERTILARLKKEMGKIKKTL